MSDRPNMHFLYIGVVEDEFHFLVQCPAYADVRKDMFTNIGAINNEFSGLDENTKFININSLFQKQLAVYLDKAWDIRHSFIYNSS
jgi:hypothetical protein